jgi:drug/metabolite transporter (DMT)-like permease
MGWDAGVRFMLISVFFFALMNLTVKSLNRLPATEIVLFRSGISLILSLVYLAQKRINPLGNNRKMLFLRGLFGVTALTLFFYTLQQLPLGTAITIQYLSPIFTVVFAAIFLRERTIPAQYVYFGLSFLGILLIRGFDPQMNTLLLVVGVVSSIFAGLAYVVIRNLSGKEHPMVVVFYFPLVAIPVMAVFAFFY